MLLLIKKKANGASTFSGTSVGGETDITIATTSADYLVVQNQKQFNQSNTMRFLDFASQGRAVTTDDYKVIVPKVFADTQDCSDLGR